MIFKIKTGATYPNLSLTLRQDGFHKFNSQDVELLTNSIITITITDNNSCIPVVLCGECCLIEEQPCNGCPSIYTIVYKWQPGDTDISGIYNAEISIRNIDTNQLFIGPIRSELKIYII